MIKKETKVTILILGIALVIILLIAIPLYFMSKKGTNNKKYFPQYQDIQVDESEVNNYNSESYIMLKNQLQDDYYFKKEALIDNYNYKSYTSADLQNMIWNFIFSYEINNSQFISRMDKEEGYFCMRTRRVIEAFEELFAVNITKDVEYLEGYFQYISKNSNGYCFDYANVGYEYTNNEIYVGIDGIQAKDGIITANVYVYEFFIMDSDNELQNVSMLQNAIAGNNFTLANDIVSNYLNGKVTHKQLDFKINNGGNFFKYQILSSKLIDY